jgi:hypothetical protein
MTLLYVIGAALSAVMWMGLIYVIVVEPIRRYLRERNASLMPERSVSVPLGRSRLTGFVGGYRATPYRAVRIRS